MSLAILFHFSCAQHVSDINISIIRSLRLCCLITTSVVLFSVRCVLEMWCGWFWVVFVLQAETQSQRMCEAIKKANLHLSTYGLPMLLMFHVCPVPDFLPGKLCRYSKCMLRSCEWMWGPFCSHSISYFISINSHVSIPVEPCYVLHVSWGTDDNLRLVWCLSGNY